MGEFLRRPVEERLVRARAAPERDGEERQREAHADEPDVVVVGDDTGRRDADDGEHRQEPDRRPHPARHVGTPGIATARPGFIAEIASNMPTMMKLDRRELPPYEMKG